MQAMLDFDYVHRFLSEYRLNNIESDIEKACRTKLNKAHGDRQRWHQAINTLPAINNPSMVINRDAISLSGEYDAQNDSIDLSARLKQLCPWRKGPFQYLHVAIKTEWNSLLKWQRIADMDIDFSEKKVLDIGCGNGAFMWPLCYQGNAAAIIGIDPMWLFYYQFLVFQRSIKNTRLCYLPLAIEQLPLSKNFDSVLSMGVLYHRKSPLDHLSQLHQLLKKGGDLVIETLVMPENTKALLTPPGRYAGMRNVWMIPSVEVLLDWIIKTQFNIVEVGEVVKTTLKEQQQSNWMPFHSLDQFIAPDNDTLTIEGFPAPHRVIIIAKSR